MMLKLTPLTPNPDEPDFDSIVTFARYFQISEATVRRLIKDGEVRSFRLGWMHRIPKSERERLVTARGAAK
jgi:excisionase family DNA binding protein